MKSIKIFFLATVAIVAGLFTACSDDDFKAGPEVDGAQVYFPENVTTQHSISDDVSSIAIPVKRIAKDEALTVAVLASDESVHHSVVGIVRSRQGDFRTADHLRPHQTRRRQGIPPFVPDQRRGQHDALRQPQPRYYGYALAVGENGNRQIPRRLVERCIHRQYVRNRCHGTQP